MVVHSNWSWEFIVFLFWFIFSIISCDTFSLSPMMKRSDMAHRNYTSISEFRVLNRRELRECHHQNSNIEINVSPNSKLGDDQFISVTVSGVMFPDEDDWIGMISPSSSNVTSCLLSRLKYAQTGDLSKLPLLCHYPVKAKFLNKDPNYMDCQKKECKKEVIGECLVRSCNGTVSFHVINIRTDIEFVFFGSGFTTPCVLKRSSPLSFANPNKPLYPHLSSLDSSATKMRLTWVSGDNKPQQVVYGKRNLKADSQVTTFSQNDMCSSGNLESPAKDFGWHDPGFIHTAVMNDLTPSTVGSYKFGSDSVGWSEIIKFKTPPAGGSSELKFLAYGDMGKTPLDESEEHFIQPGAVSVVKALMVELDSENVDSIFHIGDISYATGFLVEWDFFLSQITPLASKRSYMTAIGNHERDYDDSGSVYETADSGGECGVAYETYFPMPNAGKDKPWYSIEQGPVHFTIISTEHTWTEYSEQYKWMKNDMAAVNRSKTPWLILTGHRPMYSSLDGLLGSTAVDSSFVEAVEPLLLNAKVDLVLWGHVHNYERTCAVYEKVCKAMPKKDGQGVDVYDGSTYTAPVHAIIGMAGFKLDPSSDVAEHWSLIRKTNYGYSRVHATKTDLTLEFVNAMTRKEVDKFRITKNRN